jgi:hypothetical protein
MARPPEVVRPSEPVAQGSDGLEPDVFGDGRAGPTALTPRGTQDGPLSAEDLALLERVFERRRAFNRGVTLARTNGWTLIATALLCLPFVASDASTVLGALVLAGSGIAELRGARMLRELDLRAPKWLGTNQLVLLFAIALYCASGVYSSLHAPSPIADLAQRFPDLAGRLGELDGSTGDGAAAIDHSYRLTAVGFYLAVLVACALYQGLCARYYFTRAAPLRAHLEQTPAWALQAQRRLLGW